jgi:hypothetical protein
MATSASQNVINCGPVEGLNSWLDFAGKEPREPGNLETTVFQQGE